MKSALSTLIGSTLLATTLVGFSGAANAFQLELGGSDYYSTNSPATGATATVDFSFVDVGDDVRLDLLVKNTTNETDGAVWSRFMGFGLAYTGTEGGGDLNTLFNIDSSDYSGNSFLNHLLQNDTSVNGGQFNSLTFDIGFGNKSTLEGSGNPNGALGAGASTTVSLLLDSAWDAAATEAFFKNAFDNGELVAGARFKQVGADSSGGGSDKVLGGLVKLPPVNPPTEVPEPSAAAALGLLAAGMFGMKKKASK